MAFGQPVWENASQVTPARFSRRKPTRLPVQSSSARISRISNWALGTHRVTSARQSYSGPNPSSYCAPSDRLPGDRFVHQAFRPSGVLTA